MLNRIKLRDIAAKVHYWLCRNLGVPFTFSNRNKVAYVLYGAYLNPQVKLVEEGGSVSEYKTAQFEVAINQNGFGPQDNDVLPFTGGDELVYQGVHYHIDENGVQDLTTLGAVYSLSCTEIKRLSTGIS